MNTTSFQALMTLEAPGIMILASAIFLFAMTSKYSLIVKRIRQLKEEKRRYYDSQSNSESDSYDLSNMELQISHLIHRVSMVRFSIVGFVLGSLFFIVNAVLIGVSPASLTGTHYWVTISFFFAGMLSMATGLVFISIETWKGYRVVKLEVSELASR